jgi:hypothetical protein
MYKQVSMYVFIGMVKRLCCWLRIGPDIYPSSAVQYGSKMPVLLYKVVASASS